MADRKTITPRQEGSKKFDKSEKFTIFRGEGGMNQAGIEVRGSGR